MSEETSKNKYVGHLGHFMVSICVQRELFSSTLWGVLVYLG